MARNEFQEPEPCPALIAWRNCAYCFNDSVTSSWIEKWCLGDYKTCGRYQEHAQNQAEFIPADSPDIVTAGLGGNFPRTSTTCADEPRPGYGVHPSRPEASMRGIKNIFGKQVSSFNP
jgi:hypothetical protein